MVPFIKATFASEMKPKISGANLTLSFDNLESSLVKIGVEISDLLTAAVYEAICGITEASEPTAAEKKALDYMQRAMLHFAIYQHSIYLIAKISNDGITVKKNDNETTIFKYQQDELNNKLIGDAWFWMNELIKCLNANIPAEEPETPTIFSLWKVSTAKTEMDKYPITVDDFKKWLGINSEYFVMTSLWLIRDVWTDCILSRQKAPVKTEAMAKAVCYEVIARACLLFPYYALPDTIRKDLQNEFTKTKDISDNIVRDKISQRYQIKADNLWLALDSEIARNPQTEENSVASTEVYISAPTSESAPYGF